MQKQDFQILVVDDSPTFTNVISDIINRNIHDTKIRIANSGMEAIRVLGNNPIDLIMMDMFMPVFDGIEMAKIIRANPRTSRIPIIFISGSDPAQELMQKALEIGGIDYLNKSFKEIELVRLINLYLRFINWEREINEQLQVKIFELNIEIQRRKEVEKSLIETAEKLKDANNTKDKFFSIIAHDLKNPLSSFKNLADVLVSDFQEMSDKELEEFLVLLRNSSTNLYSLLDNLLVWSRTQTGVLVARPIKFNLLFSVLEIIKTVQNNATDKKISLNYKIDDKIEVLADVNMISTVIRNLTTNSIKFTNFGGKIDISAQILDEKVKITIKDNGVGMSEDEISKLFIVGNTKTKLGTNMEKGTGLGLLICYEFINLHNSILNVKSTEGVGTEFSFELPLGLE
jgi:signal transduction histidine kinase